MFLITKLCFFIFSFQNTLSFALLLLILLLISSFVASIGFSVIIFPILFSLKFLNLSLTILSSKEWKLITTSSSTILQKLQALSAALLRYCQAHRLRQSSALGKLSCKYLPGVTRKFSLNSVSILDNFH